MLLDKSKALADFNIPEPEYDELLLEFVQQAEEKIVQIENALTAGVIGDAAELAHSLKGVAANMRLDTCFDIARGIELNLKKGATKYIGRRISDLRSAIANIRDSIVRWPESSINTDPSP
jgi:HPt (histidine-containing phosphotransfer) domain-containing protein